MKEVEVSLSNLLGPQANTQIESFLEKGQDTSPSTPATYVANIVEQQPSTDIGSLIASLTPL